MIKLDYIVLYVIIYGGIMENIKYDKDFKLDKKINIHMNEYKESSIKKFYQIKL